MDCGVRCRLWHIRLFRVDQLYVYLPSIYFVSYAHLYYSTGIGVFQEYYQTHQLKEYTSQEIAWIPSLEAFMMFIGGLWVGRVYGKASVLLWSSRSIAGNILIRLRQLWSSHPPHARNLLPRLWTHDGFDLPHLLPIPTISRRLFSSRRLNDILPFDGMRCHLFLSQTVPCARYRSLWVEHWWRDLPCHGPKTHSSSRLWMDDAHLRLHGAWSDDLGQLDAEESSPTDGEGECPIIHDAVTSGETCPVSSLSPPTIVQANEENATARQSHGFRQTIHGAQLCITGIGKFLDFLRYVKLPPAHIRAEPY